MIRRILFNSFALFCILAAPMLSAVHGQDGKQSPKWTYKVVLLADHPEIATKELNELATAGWHYVGPVGPRLTAFKRIDPAAEQSKVSTLSGIVTLDGKPLAKGTIQFMPIGVKLPVITANIVDGKYTAEMAAGRMMVAVRSQKSIIGKKGKDDAIIEMIPARYNEMTRLVIEALPGKNEVNLDLTGK